MDELILTVLALLGASILHGASTLKPYRRALELARQLGDRLPVSKWLRNLADAYLLLGSPAFARKFEVEADLLSKALTEERKRAAHVAASLMNHVPDASSLHLRSRAS
jgi:Zn-dependent protease with chaperone function